VVIVDPRATALVVDGVRPDRVEELAPPSGPDPAEPDDAWWFWEKLVECDGLIVSTPIISRTVTGRLKLLGDRLLGPNADVAIIRELVAARAAGQEPVVPFRVDERVLKPRVAGFIALGGSLTSQWKTLALPVLHTLTFSMQTAVADQVVFEGAGTPRSIVLDDAALERAAQLGRNVGSQLGRAFDDVEYRGAPGVCPMCHLDVVVLRGAEVECATCGARGTLEDARVTSSTRVPGFTPATSSSVSKSGAFCGSASSTQSRGAALQSSRCRASRRCQCTRYAKECAHACGLCAVCQGEGRRSRIRSWSVCGSCLRAPSATNPWRA